MEILLTLDVAVVVVENIKHIWYQPTTSTTKSQILLSASGDRRSPLVAGGRRRLDLRPIGDQSD